MQIVTLNDGKAVLTDKAIVIEVIREEDKDVLRVVNASGQTLTFVFSSQFESGKFHDLENGADEKVLINFINKNPEEATEEEEEN